MRIAFMGTPDFAVPSLAALIHHGYEVVGVFCQPDRPVGRGKKVAVGPVKHLALEHDIPVFQPQRIKSAEGVEMLRSLKPDLVVTAAFGQILSREVLDIPAMGTVNVHASLLPKYRGSAPINWCIINGESYTGVTTMLTDEGIDTGDMLLAESIPIQEDETAGQLTERLAELGARVLIDTLKALDTGDCPRTSQDAGAASYYPMLKKQHGQIDWHQSAKQIANLVRGVNPWPGAYTQMGGHVLKVWQAKAVEQGDLPAGKPGEVLISGAKSGVVVACGQGCLELIEIQAPNSKRMQARSYVAGKPIERGTILGGGIGE